MNDTEKLAQMGRNQTAEDAARVLTGIHQMKARKARQRALASEALKHAVTELTLLHDDVRGMGIDPRSEAGKVVVLGILAQRAARSKETEEDDDIPYKSSFGSDW